MADTVKKSIFFSPYYRKQFAEWLSEQAAKGLFLEEIDKKCIFQKREPKRQYYYICRIEEAVGNSMKQQFEELGWDYVCSYKKVHIFTCSYSNEIPSYLEQQDNKELYKDLIKDKLKDLLIIWLIAFVFFVFSLWSSQGKITFVYNMYKEGLGECTVLAVLLLATIWDVVLLASIRVIWKREKAEWPERKESDKRWLLSMERISKIGAQVISVGFTCLSFILIWTRDEYRYDAAWLDIPAEEQSGYPIPSLSELEGEESLSVEGDSFYMERGRFLKVESCVYEDAKDATAGYWVAYIETDIQIFIEQFMKEYMLTKEIGSTTPQIINMDGADTCYYRENDTDSKFSLSVRKGKKIVYMEYYGEMTYEQVASKIIEKL